MAGEDDSSEQPSASNWMTTVGKFSKFLFIMTCYTVLFITIVQHARWFLNAWSLDHSQVPVFVSEWILCVRDADSCQPEPAKVLKGLGLDVLLFIGFMAQHSLLAERNLSGSFLHRKVFMEWKVNGALYTLTTAIALQGLMRYWTIVPVYVWNFPQVQFACTVLHVLSWFALYGTTLMQDMPELIGLHQVVFTNESTSRKSSEFQSMLRKQRHLGFVPFSVLVATCSLMTLDRFLFLIILAAYSYFMWRDTASFEYIREMTSRKRTRLSEIGTKED